MGPHGRRRRCSDQLANECDLDSGRRFVACCPDLIEQALNQQQVQQRDASR